MAELLLKEPIEEIHEPAVSRRFELPDLSRHGGWLLKRFLVLFPDMTEKYIAGYLSGLIYNNEHLFLYQEHAVALAQLVHSPGIKPAKVVQERFVWVEDKTDKQQSEFAADFYTHMKLWAQRIGAERIIVCENSDVPKSLIENRLGRVFDTKVSHVRV
jgi:hypothetical protein